MKNLILVIALCLVSVATYATDHERFNQAMGATLTEFGQAKDINALQEVANKFERIASAETAEWLPNYYAALVYSIMAAKQTDAASIDKYLDKADGFIEKMSKQAVDTPDEVEVMKAQVAMMRISADGPGRWMQYGGTFEGAVAKAKAINPENPRAYALKAQMVYYTPAQFGGGAEKACPEIQIAMQKFANFKSANPLAPRWGADQISGMAKECK